jgi:hypothetical protein
MKSIRYMKAAGTFCQALLGRNRSAQASSAAGQRPEDVWLHQMRRPETKGCPRYALFCFGGSHEGEVFFLTQATTFLGPFAGASIVLTPGHAAESSAYQIDLESQPKVRAQSGAPFLLNGRPTTQADVFDYDEVELLGNRFLVLDLLTDSDRGTQ